MVVKKTALPGSRADTRVSRDTIAMAHAGVRVAVRPRQPRVAAAGGRGGGEQGTSDSYGGVDVPDTTLRTSVTPPHAAEVGRASEAGQRLVRDSLCYDVFALDGVPLFDVDTAVCLRRAELARRLLPGELHNMWHIGVVDALGPGGDAAALTIPITAPARWLLAALELADIGVVCIDAALRMEASGTHCVATVHVDVRVPDTHIGTALSLIHI